MSAEEVKWADMLRELRQSGDEIAALRFHWWTPNRKALEDLQETLLFNYAKLQRIVKRQMEGEKRYDRRRR